MHALRDMYYKRATECLKTNKKMEVYRDIKKIHRLEPYLISNLKTEWKISIAQLRISAHNFPVESCRKLNLARQDRKCMMCKNGDIGDEFHYMFKCTHEGIHKVRSELNSRIVQSNANYATLNDQCKFRYLLSLADKDTWHYLGLAIHTMMKLVSSRSICLIISLYCIP